VARGRKPGQGTFAGGRKKGVPNKKGSKQYEVYFRCGEELFEALSLAAIEQCQEDSVNLYARRFLKESHKTYIQQVRDAHNRAT
jgi:hypothetical protein